MSIDVSPSVLETFYYDSPIGRLFGSFDKKKEILYSLSLTAPSPATETKVLSDKLPLKHWLDAYFKGEHQAEKIQFKINIGTTYQQAVWQSISQIPFGEVTTYSAIATQLGSHPRAVGQACKVNPIILVIPCHRVVGKSSLGGYAGRQTELKEKLLALEGVSL